MPETPISQTIEHREGHYYIQDAASMLPVELFDFKNLEDPMILDMAASPGGKTTHLISKTGDHGLVIANDASRDRITALRLILQTWGGGANRGDAFPGREVWHVVPRDIRPNFAGRAMQYAELKKHRISPYAGHHQPRTETAFSSPAQVVGERHSGAETWWAGGVRDLHFIPRRG